jgi:hypothetical protein
MFNLFLNQVVHTFRRVRKSGHMRRPVDACCDALVRILAGLDDTAEPKKTDPYLVQIDLFKRV